MKKYINKFNLNNGFIHLLAKDINLSNTIKKKLELMN